MKRKWSVFMVVMCALLLSSSLFTVAFCETNVSPEDGPGFDISAKEGDTATTAYETYMIGSDGEPFIVSGPSENILYRNDGTYYLSSSNPTEKMKYFKIKTGGEENIGYCIEWGIPYSAPQSYGALSDTRDEYFKNLSVSIQNGIKLALIYGKQPNKNVPVAGCNNADWIFATQCIIWEYQQRLRHSPTSITSRDGMPADYFSKSLKGRPAEKMYNWMLDQMSHHKDMPSFLSQSSNVAPFTMTYDEDNGDYRVTLIDDFNTGKDIQVSDKRVKVERKGNEYTFSSEEKIDEETLSSSADLGLSSAPLLIWGSVGTHQAIITGVRDEYKAYMALEGKDSQLKVVKTSEDDKVEDVEFVISKEGQEDLTVATDVNGEILLELQPGTYTITEITGEEYEPIEPQTVTLSGDDLCTVYFHNTLIKLVPEEDTPKVPKVTQPKEKVTEKPVPKTGDESNLQLYLTAFVIATLVLGGTVFFMRRS